MFFNLLKHLDKHRQLSRNGEIQIYLYILEPFCFYLRLEVWSYHKMDGRSANDEELRIIILAHCVDNYLHGAGWLWAALALE